MNDGATASYPSELSNSLQDCSGDSDPLDADKQRENTSSDS